MVHPIVHFTHPNNASSPSAESTTTAVTTESTDTAMDLDSPQVPIDPFKAVKVNTVRRAYSLKEKRPS